MRADISCLFALLPATSRGGGKMITKEPLGVSFSALYLFLCFAGVLAGRDLPPCTRSCGKLGNISYPFRLLGDPPHCGSPDHELVCEADEAIWKLAGVKYHVINISYNGQKIRLVDERFASGSCNLPPQSLFPDSFDSFRTQVPLGVFVSCLSVVDDESYKPLKCLSNETHRVYLLRNQMLMDLKPSCHFVSATPLSYSQWDSISGDDAFIVLSKGFVFYSGFKEMRIDCWGTALEKSRNDTRRDGILKSLPAMEGRLFSCLEFRAPKQLINSLLFVATNMVIVLLVLGRFITMPLCVFVYLLRKFQEEHAFVDIVEKFLKNQNMLAPARYTYPEILIITNHFEKKLGQGGFGSVFQGKLPGGYMVAVNILTDSKFNGEDFMNEVSTIGRIHHINVMQLIGYCSERRRRALVYEYMPNGSLDKYVCPGKGTGPSLTWEKLNEIALGIARGLEYLHRGCDVCILHFDIKPHNILLDYDFTPKVSDFGLAKLYPKEQSLVSVSAARGTMGYIAPELVSRNFGPISYKSDVYSFGMLLLEVAGAKRNLETVTGKSSGAYFPDWVYDRLEEGKELDEGVDAKMGEIERTLCIVGLWCIQMNPSDRPSMSGVVEMLEGRTPGLQMPAKPVFPSSQNSFARRSAFDSFSAELPAISED